MDTSARLSDFHTASAGAALTGKAMSLITPNIYTHNYLHPVSLAIVLKKVDEGKASSSLIAVSILTRNSTGIKSYECTGAGWDKVKKTLFFFYLDSAA